MEIDFSPLREGDDHCDPVFSLAASDVSHISVPFAKGTTTVTNKLIPDRLKAHHFSPLREGDDHCDCERNPAPASAPIFQSPSRRGRPL